MRPFAVLLFRRALTALRFAVQKAASLLTLASQSGQLAARALPPTQQQFADSCGTAGASQRAGRSVVAALPDPWRAASGSRARPPQV